MPDHTQQSEQVHAIIMATFQQFLNQDPALLKQIKAHKIFECDKNSKQSIWKSTWKSTWHFTLPNLHQFLSQHHPLIAQTSYKEFRKTLFDHPTNQQLGKLNATVTITITKPTEKVDQNTYCLQSTK